MNENGKHRREYSARWVRGAWLQFWGLVAPAVLLALWGAWSKSEVTLALAGFGLGTVWGNWQTAAFHEMRHKAPAWSQHNELMPALVYLLRMSHFLHHEVVKCVEAGPAAEWSPKRQKALDRSAALGLPAMIYLVGQAAYVWGPPMLLAGVVIGWSANWIAVGFMAGTLFTVCATDHWGHIWHHNPRWKTGLMGALWHLVFSTEPCHDWHHKHDATEEGSWGSYPWCMPEVLVPDFARLLYMFTWTPSVGWLVMPALASILMGAGSGIPFLVTLMPVWSYIAWVSLGVYADLVRYAKEHNAYHAKKIRALLNN